VPEAACRRSRTVLVARGILFSRFAVGSVVRWVVGFALRYGGVALPSTAPHEEEEYQGGEEEDTAGNADAEADFDAGVGGA